MVCGTLSDYRTIGQRRLTINGAASSSPVGNDIPDRCGINAGNGEPAAPDSSSCCFAFYVVLGICISKRRVRVSGKGQAAGEQGKPGCGGADKPWRVLYCLAQKMPVFQISGRFLVFKLKEIFSPIASFESRFFLILHNINPK